MSTYIINKNHVITMNRGDSVSLPIDILIGKFPESQHKLKIEDNDIIFFGLMFPRITPQSVKNALATISLETSDVT